MGEEPYYIDLITEYIQENVLTAEEKAFNQVVLYGKDTDVPGIITAARRFPMMSPHQVVIVKEAQVLPQIEDLILYVENPLSSTLLVVNYKYKKLDKRKKLYRTIEQKGLVFDSPRLYEDKIPAWIVSYLNARGKKIEPKAAMMLTEFLGSDLGKIANELEKLILVLGEGIEKSKPDRKVLRQQSQGKSDRAEHRLHVLIFQQVAELSFSERPLEGECGCGPEYQSLSRTELRTGGKELQCRERRSDHLPAEGIRPEIQRFRECKHTRRGSAQGTGLQNYALI
jgi:hypothetical protein